MTDRVLALRTELLSRVKEAYYTARITKQEHRELLERLAAIYNDPAYSRLPRYAVNYVRGYEQAIMDDLYRHHLVYGRYLGGRFVSTHSRRDDYYGKQGVSPTEMALYSVKEASEAGHYWAEASEGGVMRPFFTGNTRT